MNTSLTPQTRNLDQWLDYIGQVHPKEIELGLARSRQVAKSMGLIRPAPQVVTVAGTNGKGSTVACLEALLSAQGLRCGTYTSPHIHDFNERIRVCGAPAENTVICAAFLKIEKARGQVSLSYFEFATLAALSIFEESELDVVVLEVGLGGRLDAVNIVDPDVSVITSIALDHEDWLGNDRETIALEKAGILRNGMPFVCGDEDPPQSLLAKSRNLGCQLYRWRTDFQLETEGDQLQWRGKAGNGGALQYSASMPAGLLASNVACALQALALLDLPWPIGAEQQGLDKCAIAGRQEWRQDRQNGTQILLDVAHNPAAAKALAAGIENWRSTAVNPGKVIVVFAAMADKKVEDMAVCLETNTDIWYIAHFDDPRCLGAAELENRLLKHGFSRPLRSFETLAEAYRVACDGAVDTPESGNCLVVVTGSFFTVAELRNETR